MKLPTLNKKQRQILVWGISSMVVGVLAIKLTTVYLHSKGYEIKVNSTFSLPERVWWVNTNQKHNFKKGDYFLFYAPNDKMLTDGESTPVIKIVKGVSGDYVSFYKKSVLLNHEVIGHVWSITEKGTPLIPIESQVIGAGCYFAWTPALYSYDSRYKDIDLVCESQNRIIGSATPLF